MQMSYLKKIEYEIVLKDSFRIIRNCPKCGRKTYFQNTKKFRINANGNKLDIWLIYQCEECNHTLNLSIYERQKVNSNLSNGRSIKKPNNQPSDSGITEQEDCRLPARYFPGCYNVNPGGLQYKYIYKQTD